MSRDSVEWARKPFYKDRCPTCGEGYAHDGGERPAPSPQEADPPPSPGGPGSISDEECQHAWRLYASGREYCQECGAEEPGDRAAEAPHTNIGAGGGDEEGYMHPDVLATLASQTGLGREVFMLDNNLQTPYSDQFSLGMRNAVGDWLTDVTISRVESHDGFVFLLGNRLPDGSFFAPGLSWGPPWGQGFAPFGNLILGTNGLETKTNALYLKAEKPYTAESGWSVTVSR